MFRGDDCCPSVLFGDDDSYDPFGFGFMHDNPDDLPDEEPHLMSNEAPGRCEAVECSEENFWRSLDVNADPVSEKQAVQTLDLFAYNDDLGGVCDAIIDITDGLLDGIFTYSEHLMSTIEGCVATFPAAVSLASNRHLHTSAEDRIRAVRDRIALKESSDLGMIV